ncbi:hypothetical protein [Streptomyces sp. NPDC088400]|uniref:hypothetical protein n=1 Tax=Streptomyces sp. NPDC088400 TaxID=3365861 RepID=UPI0037F5AC03
MSDQGGWPVTDGLFGNHRTFILGILGSIVGLTGVIGWISRGAGILEILALAGIGILGLFLTVGYILVQAKKPRRAPKRPR